MKGRFSKIVIALMILASSAFTVTGFVANSFGYSMSVQTLDTVAGYSTFLKSSPTSANTKVIFDVYNPHGDKIEIPAMTNVNGVAQVELSNYYIKTAGQYRAGVRLSTATNSGNFTNFKVFPGDLSATNSTISPSDQVIHTGGETAKLTVKLADDYNNPLSGHLIKLISSSSKDKIQPLANSYMTDANGEVSFQISSTETNASTYIAYDVTEDVVLESRAKVAYFGSSDEIFSVNRPTSSASIFAATGNGSTTVHHFEFENVSSPITPGSNVTFTLSARDILDQPVTNYTGRVRFSVLSDNFDSANLPNDYTFKAGDLGSHTFSLAANFTLPGTYNVEARDLDSVTVAGTHNFVVSASGLSGNNVSSNNGLMITNPVPGTYSNNVQVISGTAAPGARLRIFDNNAQIGSVIANVNGTFSFTTSFLDDGLHSFYVASVNDIGTILDTSSPVSINVDTAAPDQAQVVVTPSGSVSPGSLVTIQLYTQENLSAAALIFENGVYDLEDSGQGYFEGNFGAPMQEGSYSLDFLLVDELGNESQMNDAGVLTVGTGSSNNFGTLGDVTNLEATASDHRVTLEWNAPDFGSNITNYRVFYGLSANQLTEAVDTFTNSTTWYVPNLKNGTEYYFAVVAVDASGNISEHFSNIVASTPKALVTEVEDPDVTNGTAGGDAFEDMESDVSETGPEIYWVIGLSVLAGFGYSLTSKRRVC